MGVDIGSRRYKAGSGDILFMGFAINMYVHCCFPKWYVQLLCVHYVCALCLHWCIVFALVHCMCIDDVFARSGFV
jgi:hypothetical protein